MTADSKPGTERKASRTDHAWLAGVLPEGAHALRVEDPELASTLADAGAAIVTHEADVHIVSGRPGNPTAACVIAVLGEPRREGGGRLARTGRRLLSHARVRMCATTVRKRLQEAGYRRTAVFFWDIGQPLREARDPSPIGGGLAERFPARALVVASRGERPASLLDASLLQASVQASTTLTRIPPSLRTGLLVMPMPEGVLRVAVGPGRDRIAGQHDALESLRALDPPRIVTDRVPWTQARGHLGLGEWSLERTLPGRLAIPPVDGALLDDCLDFLVAIHVAGCTEDAVGGPTSTAEVVSAALTGEAARAARQLGERIEELLAPVPRGFGHGDFWHGNLFVEHGRLVGVADWDSAGPGRLPLLDLLHLLFTAQWRNPPSFWGEALLSRLLPWSRRGGDHVSAQYCRRIGLELEPQMLPALVAAYWLDRVAYQLSTYEDRRRQALWLHRNVEKPLGAFTAELPGRTHSGRGGRSASADLVTLSSRSSTRRDLGSASERVLLAGGEDVGVLAAVRGLSLAGYQPWVATERARTYASYSRACAGTVQVPDPRSDPTGFVEATALVTKERSIAAVLPGTEAGLMALSAATGDFPAGVAVGVCPPDVVDRATNKALLQSLADDAGMRTPPTEAVGISELDHHDITFPAVVKPLRSELRLDDGSFGHFGAQRVESRAALAKVLSTMPEQRGLVQPFLQGRLGALGGIVWNGELVCSIEIEASRIWPPDCGTFTYALSVERDVEFSRSIHTCLASLGWNGLFQVDFIDVASERYLIDLNPRIFTSLALAVAAGLNLPAIWTDLLLGRSPQVVVPRNGVRYRFEQDDARALVAAFRGGRRGEALKGLLPRSHTTHAVYSWRDPLPTIATLAKIRSRVIARP